MTVRVSGAREELAIDNVAAGGHTSVGLVPVSRAIALLFLRFFHHKRPRVISRSADPTMTPIAVPTRTLAVCGFGGGEAEMRLVDEEAAIVTVLINVIDFPETVLMIEVTRGVVERTEVPSVTVLDERDGSDEAVDLVELGTSNLKWSSNVRLLQHTRSETRV